MAREQDHKEGAADPFADLTPEEQAEAELRAREALQRMLTKKRSVEL